MTAKGGIAAGATGRTIVANWTQSYTYDRYGNKTGVTATGVDQNNVAMVSDGLPSVTASTSTNRITTSGWEYDLTGNLIRGQNVSGVWQKFEYDAAGRLKKVKDDSNVVLETYTYGASREKLMVETSSQRTYYAWGGQSIVAEYTETGSDTSPDYSKSYIYAGSRLLMTATMVNATTETKELHHPNRLGTELVTDGGAGTSYRQTTLPFGTALAAESTGNTNQVLTSYDRSATTGLDYAVNRTYSKGQSRFTQVDPIGMSSASLSDPKSNNLYAYTQNMPTDFVDPSGLQASAGVVCMWVGWKIDTPGSPRVYVCTTRPGAGGPSQSPPVEAGGGGGPSEGASTCSDPDRERKCSRISALRECLSSALETYHSDKLTNASVQYISEDDVGTTLTGGALGFVIIRSVGGGVIGLGISFAGTAIYRVAKQQSTWGRIQGDYMREITKCRKKINMGWDEFVELRKFADKNNCGMGGTG